MDGRSHAAPAPPSLPSGLRATLQRDADALLDQGAPGVLVELDTGRGDVRVRSGLGNIERGTPVPWNARFRIGSYTKTFVRASSRTGSSPWRPSTRSRW